MSLLRAAAVVFVVVIFVVVAISTTKDAEVPMKWAQLCFDRAIDEHCKTTYQIAVHETKDIVSQSYISQVGWPWEWREIEEILRVLGDQKNTLKKDVVFVDIGANIGSFTLQMAARKIPVIAIEPMPQNLVLLHASLSHPENVALRENVLLFEIGLSDIQKNCSIWSHEKNKGNGQIVCDSDDKHPAECPECLKMAEISVTTLDTLFFNYDHEKYPIGAMKMDVECFEPLVMKGGETLFSSGLVPFVVLEFTGPVMEKRTGISPLLFLHTLDRWNYDIHLKSFQGPQLHPQNFAAHVADVFNVFLVHRRPH